MRSRLLCVLLLTLALVAPAASTHAAPAAAAATSTITLTPRYPVYAGNQAPLDIVLTADGQPVPNAPVTLERFHDGAWHRLATLTTRADGTVTTQVTLWRVAEHNQFRARFEGSTDVPPAGTGAVQAPLRKRGAVVTLTGPSSIKDGSRGTLTVRWTTGSGDPVDGSVRIDVRRPGADWAVNRTIALGPDGVASFAVRPSTETRWRAVARPLDWVEGRTSKVLVIRLAPAGTPVVLPAAAPRPRISLPEQPRASAAGPNPVVSAIPDAVWNSMVGRSWHSGCPVGRSGLRLVRVNYWDFGGTPRRGELVVARAISGKVANAFSALYRKRVPIRSMYRVDRFGWSDRVDGADDYSSMAAGNTSAFNCRHVVGRPGVRSPHTYGRAIDINTWENPYHSADGWVPNSWWAHRSHSRVAWRTSGHTVVSTLRNYGFRWTYGTEDSQHFDVAGGDGRIIVIPECVDVVCD